MDFSNPASQEAPEKLLLEGWDHYPREVKNKIAQIEESMSRRNASSSLNHLSSC